MQTKTLRVNDTPDEFDQGQSGFGGDSRSHRYLGGIRIKIQLLDHH